MALLNQTQQDYYDGNDFGGYQFISLEHIITNFTIAYVGEGKIIPKIKRTDIAFHAQRAIQELSFDTFKSIKSQEITLPPSNTMVLPQDYVNYTKVCWVDSNGIERPLYPTKHTSNPTPILQDSDGDYSLTAVGTLDETSQLVVLDGEYKNILVGMQVNAPNIPLGTVVGSVSNDGSITTIGLVDIYSGGYPSLGGVNDVIDGAAVLPTFTGTETLSFNMFPEPHPSSAGGQATAAINTNLIIEEGSAVILEGNTYSLGSFSPLEPGKITASSTTEAAKVSIGMYVSSTHFTPGTKVIDVNGAVITTDSPAHEDSTNTTHGTTNEITFMSIPGDSTTWNSFSSDTSNSTGDANGYNHDTDIYDLNLGQRYGVDPAIAQGNGTYYIDNLKGLIHFSSNISGKTVILKYISDGLGADNEMIVHKFAEEAVYKCIAYAIFSTTMTGQQLVPRFKKEKFAAVRQAKLRLSNIKIEELTQLMRGKSKWIKH